MKLPFFATFLAFIVFLTFQMRHHDKLNRKHKQDYINRELAANSTRKKSIDKLDYIMIPDNIIELGINRSDEHLQSFSNSLLDLSHKKIVNLTGISNTELKFAYGVANLPTLSEYDSNYTRLARTLQLYATRLSSLGLIEECKKVLEYAIDTNTDVSKTYQMLADIYVIENNINGIETLKIKATSLNSLSKTAILTHLSKL